MPTRKRLGDKCFSDMDQADRQDMEEEAGHGSAECAELFGGRISIEQQAVLTKLGHDDPCSGCLFACM